MKTDRDRENELAIGGMRNPKKALSRLPKSLVTGRAVAIFLRDAALHPSVQGTVDDLMDSRPSDGISTNWVKECSRLLLGILGFRSEQLPARTAKASSPISPEILWAWGEATDDPDACTLATWIREGAPLGFAESIPTNGIFPVVEGVSWTSEGAKSLIRDLDGWENYPSAVEENQALQELIQEA